MVDIPAAYFADAYNAWAAAGGQGLKPWEIIGLAVKEGLFDNEKKKPKPWKHQAVAKSPENAKALWRSDFFYRFLGLDYFTNYTHVKGQDNTIGYTDADAPGHQGAFENRANRLVPGISAAIDASLIATPHNGKDNAEGYDVVATDTFYILVMRLDAALFQTHSSKVPGQHLGLGYMHFNQGQGSYARFNKSAQQHLQEPGNMGKSLTEYAFQTKIPAIKDYGIPRRNAVKLMYYNDVFRIVYEDIDWTK